MADTDGPAAIRAYASTRLYSTATIERWLQLTAPNGAVLLQLATELRLGENQLRDLWDWAEEIAERDGVTLSHVLAVGPVATARARRVGRNDKLKAIKAALRRLRFPQLAAVEDRMALLIRTLQLPHTVSVTLPEHLEGDQVRIEITTDSRATWQAAATALLAAAASPACAELFRLLNEAP